MGLFSDYVKRAKRIQGKKIIVFIEKSYFGSRYVSTSHFEHDLSALAFKLEANENTKFLLRLNQQFSVQEIRDMIFYLIWVTRSCSRKNCGGQLNRNLEIY